MGIVFEQVLIEGCDVRVAIVHYVAVHHCLWGGVDYGVVREECVDLHEPVCVVGDAFANLTGR